MTSEQLQLISLGLNGLLLPALYSLVAMLWRLDRRIYRLELHLGFQDKGG